MLTQPSAISWKFVGKPYDLNSILTPDGVWEKLDLGAEEVRQSLITLIDELQSVVDASSGADNVGMTPITVLGAQTTVQATIEALVTRLQATTDSASGADLICATGISGLTGASVQALLESLKGYVDSDKVKLTTDQTIAGVKTFSSSPIVPTPTTDTQAANKSYVDSQTPLSVPNGSITDLKLSDAEGDIKQRLSAHLAENAAQFAYVKKNTPIISYQQPSVNPVRNNYKFFNAMVSNPLSDIAYTNEPIGIYASFDRGECLGEDYITILDPSGTSIPFQWENATDPRTKQDIGTYSDNSLKFGTIWILADLSAGEEKIYTIRINDTAQSHVFPDAVTYTVVSGTREEFASNSIAIAFESAVGWTIRRILANGTDLNASVATARLGITDNNYADSDTSTLASLNFISKNNAGNGVIFREWQSIFTMVYNSNIKVTFTARMWANGNVDAEFFTETTTDLSAGVLNGVLSKVNWTPISGATNIQDDNSFYAGQETAANQILVGVRDWQFLSESGDPNGYPTFTANQGSGALVYAGWKNTTPTTRTANNGAYWSTRYYISPQYGQGNAVSESLRRMNRIYTRMAKDHIENLKRKLTLLSRNLVEPMRDWDAANCTDFLGLQGLESLGLMYYQGKSDDVLVTDARTKLNTALNTYYSGGTRTGIYNAWAGDRGWEFFGRDFTVVPYLRDIYNETGDSTNKQQMIDIIHNLADATIDIEIASGGSGQIKLRGSGTDNLNAEGAAMVALAESLSIIENTDRRNCYNRIKSRFLSAVEFRNRTPYAKTSSGIDLSVKNPTSHYHSFNFYEVFKANDLQPFGSTLPSVRQYIMEASTPAGQIREIETQYNPGRRGLALTNLYMAALLAWWGGNISDLEHACQLVSHVLSRTLPSGHHEHPLDGWSGMTDSRQTSSAIESQALIESSLGVWS